MPPLVVTERARCLEDEPPALEPAAVPECYVLASGEAICPPLDAKAEASIVRFIRRARYWMADAWATCQRLATPSEPSTATGRGTAAE